jgi:hypothetical protein
MVNLLRRPEDADPVSGAVRFSWQVNDAACNQGQMAYQVWVVRDPLPRDWAANLVWDSGPWTPGGSWISRPESLHVPYEGPELEPGAAYWWRVRTWNGRGDLSPWSEPQRFCVAAPDASEATPRQRLIQTPQLPVAVVQPTPGITFVDFGRAAFGTLEVDLDCAEAGEVLVRLGEVRCGPFEIDREPGGTRRFREIRLPVEAGPGTYRVSIEPDPRNTQGERDSRKSAAILMPEYVGEVLPFRYCEIEGVFGMLRAEHVRRLAAWYPFDESASVFRSSNRILNDVWELCRYSMKATSFCGVHVDGDRERIPYEADAYINQLGYYCCDREYALSRFTHEFLIRNPTWPTEWVLFSVLLAWEDYAYTGDISSAARFYSDLDAKTLSALARDDGLISSADGRVTPDVLAAVHFRPEWTMRDIVDWPQGERDGYEMCAVNTVVNAFHYRALVLMGRLARALGRNDDADAYAVRAETVRDSMLRLLVDEESGLFVDGEGSRHSSLHATIFPLAFGVTPERLYPAAVEFMRRKGPCCSVYAVQFLLEALYRAGAADDALALMTATSERSWAHWIYDVDSTITLEAWDDRFKPNQDWNHAWGAAPANIIPRFLVGVRPLTPGFERILIEPQPGPLAHVEARIPTIRGPVSVVMTHESGRSIALELGIPANSTACVMLRGWARAQSEVWVDGHPRPATTRGGDLLVDPVGSGEHTVVVCV